MNLVDSLFISLDLDPASGERMARDSGRRLADLKKEISKTEAEIVALQRATTKDNKKASSEKLKQLRLDLAEKRKEARELRGMDAEATKREKARARGAKEAGEAFKVAGEEAIAFFAVLGAAIGTEEFLKHTIGENAELGRMSQLLGTTAQELSNWQGAVKEVGGAAEDANSSIGSLTQAFEQIQITGQSPMIPYLQRLGITLADLKDPTETLLKLADEFSRMDPREALALGQGLGLSPAMVNLLRQGREAVEGRLAAQERANKLSAEDIRLAQEVQQETARLAADFKGMENSLAVGILPALIQLVDGLRDLAQTDWGAQFPQLAAIRKDLGELIGDIEKLGKAFGGLGPIVKTSLGNVLTLLDGMIKILTHLIKAATDLAHGDFKGAGAEMAGIPKDAWTTLTKEVDAWRDMGKPAAPARPGKKPPVDTTIPDGSGGAGVRRNNPGNLRPASGQGFRVFDTPEAGLQAMARQLRIYQDRHHLDTIAAIVGRWAPPGENRTSDYIGTVARMMGIGANVALDLHDPKTLIALMAAMIRVEQGRSPFTAAQIAAQVGATSATAPAVAAPPAGARVAAQGASSTHNIKSDTRIGTINVQTRATDAPGIAKAIGPAIKRHSAVTISNTGLAI